MLNQGTLDRGKSNPTDVLLLCGRGRRSSALACLAAQVPPYQPATPQMNVARLTTAGPRAQAARSTSSKLVFGTTTRTTCEHPTSFCLRLVADLDSVLWRMQVPINRNNSRHFATSYNGGSPSPTLVQNFRLAAQCFHFVTPQALDCASRTTTDGHQAMGFQQKRAAASAAQLTLSTMASAFPNDESTAPAAIVRSSERSDPCTQRTHICGGG